MFANEIIQGYWRPKFAKILTNSTISFYYEKFCTVLFFTIFLLECERI